MKLFLISQDTNEGYETYTDVVVAAETGDVARNMDPSEDGALMDWDDQEKVVWSDWCRYPEDVSVKYLGEAVEGTRRSVICASFFSVG